MSKKPTDKIPVSKIKRASKVLGATVKVGGNYVKYYAKKSVNSSTSKDSLHEDNASDIYNTLSQLKGSALKIAQMMSMDTQMIPKAYQDKFSMAQYSAPALSYPLIAKTFKTQTGKTINETFDTFTKDAVHAASIGQVHKATKGNKNLAVKIQYPGVGDAISSDLKLVAPLAGKMFGMKKSEMAPYLNEVESKMLEETNYELELKQGRFISESCSSLENLTFPKYYPEYSHTRILVMDWMEGPLLPEYLEQNPSKENRDKVGQAMWDFIMFSVSELKQVHADPHPGNFIVVENDTLCPIDFGCVKVIPEDFYNTYFQILKPGASDNIDNFKKLLYELELLLPSDTEANVEYLMTNFIRMVKTLGKPFSQKNFDFSSKEYFKEIYDLGEEFSKDPELKKLNTARGSSHSIYILRTFFGLYTLLHQIQSNIEVRYKPF